MARSSRIVIRNIIYLPLLAPLAAAQLSNLPDLKTATRSNNNDASSTAAGANTAFHLTGLPTIAGAGIPPLIVPNTGGAPFMQKSSLPEGTFFIAVGATLAFLGACVLLWRAMVAWSINRSVKRSAMVSMEKTGHTSTYGAWNGSRKSSNLNGMATVKPHFYKDIDGGSMSMENLTTTGKATKPHFRDSTTEHRSSTMPQDLFFSPTAHARESTMSQNRGSSYMPAGFYASSNAIPAGGAPSTTIGVPPAPFAQQHKRQSTQGSEMSRSSLPYSRDSTTLRGVSRDGPLNSRDGFGAGGGGLRAPPSRGSERFSGGHLYANPSSSSLMVGQSSNGSDITPSRAPSLYLEDLLENHGNRPRERF